MNTPTPPAPNTAPQGAPPAGDRRPKPLGKLLKEKGLITEDHILFALQEQKVTKEKLGETLERMGFVTQYDIAISLAEQENIPFVDIAQLVPTREVLRMFNKNICLANEFFPLESKERSLKVATSNFDIQRIGQQISRLTGLNPDFVMAERGKLIDAVHQHYFFLENPVEELLEREVRLVVSDKNMVRTPDQIIRHLFNLALKHRASDIHFRPLELSLNIAFRVDGVMRSILSLPPELKRIVTTLKMRAGMDIAEQRLPQDGSFTESILNHQFYFRASTTVCPYGENLVLRMLPVKNEFMGMQQLGFFKDDIDHLRQVFAEPFGLVLLAGPTGSGKTTTLYAALQSQNLLEKNVLTVENPIEYRIPLLRQTEVNVKAGYTFANAVRYFLRHDPDIILVGEIRDQETATTALSAASTGHLVMSTLHTNTAVGAIPRLQALGIPSFMLSDSLLGVISQRLARRVCITCKEAYEATPSDRRYLRLGEEQVTLHRGKGCEACNGTGHRGRTVIYEILVINQEISNMVGREATQEEIHDVAVRSGFKTIFDVGKRKVLLGELSVVELKRVMGVSTNF